VKAVLRERLRFVGRPGAGLSINEEEITEQEYVALAGNKAIVDSPKAINGRARI
jgi:hypothetical protein